MMMCLSVREAKMNNEQIKNIIDCVIMAGLGTIILLGLFFASQRSVDRIIEKNRTGYYVPQPEIVEGE